MKARVWIVEMLVGQKWEPCTKAALTKSDAEQAARQWRERNPHERFRIQRYERAALGGKK